MRARVHHYAILLICIMNAAIHGQPATQPGVAQVGQMKTRGLTEASGLARGVKYPDVFWTHNDGGDGVLYAIRADGSLVGKRRVAEKFSDWEDIAAGENGELYLADVG